MQGLKQEPIYLPDADNHPRLGRGLDLTRVSRSAGRETWTYGV
jgi:hypothetical protein